MSDCACAVLVALGGEPAHCTEMETWLERQLAYEGLRLRTGHFVFCVMPRLPETHMSDFGIQLNFDGKQQCFPWPHVHCALHAIRQACLSGVRDCTDSITIAQWLEDERDERWSEAMKDA